MRTERQIRIYALIAGLALVALEIFAVQYFAAASVLEPATSLFEHTPFLRADMRAPQCDRLAPEAGAEFAAEAWAL